VQGGVRQLARKAAREGDRRVAVAFAVPQMHRGLDLVERERPRTHGDGQFLHRGPRARPERVSDGLVLDAQRGTGALRRTGQVALTSSRRIKAT
jgi:hypothetical protein